MLLKSSLPLFSLDLPSFLVNPFTPRRDPQLASEEDQQDSLQELLLRTTLPLRASSLKFLLILQNGSQSHPKRW